MDPVNKSLRYLADKIKKAEEELTILKQKEDKIKQNLQNLTDVSSWTWQKLCLRWLLRRYLARNEKRMKIISGQINEYTAAMDGLRNNDFGLVLSLLDQIIIKNLINHSRFTHEFNPFLIVALPSEEERLRNEIVQFNLGYD